MRTEGAPMKYATSKPPNAPPAIVKAAICRYDVRLCILVMQAV